MFDLLAEQVKIKSLEAQSRDRRATYQNKTSRIFDSGRQDLPRNRR
jgi:hypothetical protein